ncbi:amidohydrolase family protein [Pedobacter boryungensis]|uniref:Amidohydrolase family protein n=1 Tax=Pedobacter boryungensis TaxID=869962 RepID=A0ABX2D9R6_9SPHI|nr:amidohydrolase family protein [Pedobacter boryungensis]NQX30800.1 amidohydrolase family protein [Pedobacter boryungensis]
MIDSHVHFWKFDPIRDSWITNEMAVLRQDYLPNKLIDELKANQVDGCIAVQADQSITETEFLLNLAHQYSFIKGIVGWIDLKSPNLDEQLEKYAKQPLIKGWRHIVQAEPAGFLLQHDFIQGINTLRHYNYTYDILVQHAQLPEVIEFLNRTENQSFVIDHCAKPDLKNREMEDWAKNIRLIAQQKHVFCKLSGLLTECDWVNWDEKTIFNCLDVIFESFGTERIIFGSDWPVLLLASNYTNWISLIKKYTKDFTAADQQAIFNDNAVKFYNIN